MCSTSSHVTDELRRQTAAAICLVQERVRWKPNSAVAHLLKPRLRGHLPADATLADYGRIISTIVTDDGAIVYVY
ncbi:MAG TPA: hypothetical protein EYP04_04350 [Anaerolineae bacterium]|nr:hypothetical protein [Anaerolineae bacterium]HIQ05361.1 hypothetical protein [Anaerolineae bacterium]